MEDDVALAIQNESGIARLVGPPDGVHHIGHTEDHGNHTLDLVVDQHGLADDKQHLIEVLGVLWSGNMKVVRRQTPLDGVHQLAVDR